MPFAKQRGRNNTVTATIPVLVDAKKGESGRPGTFMSPIQPTPLVRPFENSDFKRAMQRLPEVEKAHFLAVFALVDAVQKKDSLALRGAVERMKKALALRRKVAQNLAVEQSDEEKIQSLYHSLGVLFGLGTGHQEEAKEIWDGVKLSPREEKDAQSLLSRQISQELLGVQLVLWWTGQYFTPALYCPYPLSALYVQALHGITGKAKAFAGCPYCGNLFMQERTDQHYCCIAHREAHRVARWRARKKKGRRTRTSMRREITMALFRRNKTCGPTSA